MRTFLILTVVGLFSTSAFAEDASQQCKKLAAKAALKRAKKLADNASVTAVKTLYSGTWAHGDVILVRISDETEPSDYVVITKRSDEIRNKNCIGIKTTSVVGDGMLPDLQDLN
ncbi:MAG: hypothetical protein AB1540_09280 [Bdellovibrionota bacterium]